MKRVRRPATTMVVLGVVLGMVLTGCASSGDSSSGSDSGATADVNAAKAQLQPYESAPADFPVTETLGGSVTGKKVSYLDCGTPVCGLGWTNVQNAAKVVGVDLTRVNAGLQAESVSSSFDTLLSQKVDGAIDPALPNPIAQNGLQSLKQANVPVAAIGVVNGDRTLLPAIVGSEVALGRLGELIGTYLVATFGNDVNAVLYVSPELELTKIMYDGAARKLKELCPGCKLRSADIPVAALGTNAATIVTDDLQAHPNTKQVAFTVGEQAIGLPAAMKAAGLSIDTVTAGPTPDSLQQIKDGEMKAAIGYDLTYVGWTAVDSLARLMLGKPLSKAVQNDIVPMQVLTKDSVTDGMIKNGWSAFPDIATRYGRLWTAQ